MFSVTSFSSLQTYGHDRVEHAHWFGLNLYGLDGVLWRTPDTKENSPQFVRTPNKVYDAVYPHIMVCMMNLAI